MEKNKSVTIQIFGTVQGVGFRYAAYHEAKRLQINGLVRNNADGSVYLEIAGPKVTVDQFIQWCEHGPRFAKVEKIDVRDNDRDTNYHDFSML